MSEKKRVLITGKGSYIGTSVKSYLLESPRKYEVEELETKGLVPSAALFEGYDVVFHAAGIAHIKETEENKHLYYEVNRDLTLKIAESAKTAGVKQFIILSSMSVYGLVTGHITKSTEPKPVNAYGDSKLQADIELEKLADDSFKVAVLRPPMVYGKGCKGNYQQLRSFALKSPVFPKYKNERSMLYIGNLCEFVKRLIDNRSSGVFFPQNKEYVCTSDMVFSIASYHKKSILLLSVFYPFIKILRVNVINKVFGNLTYEKVDTIDMYSFEESVRLCEE